MLPFHFIILGLSMVCSLQSGVAATTDITCGGRFPKAGGGLAKRTDGCSSLSDNPDQVRDSWGSANFRGVCDEHDRCYYTIGANVDVCNSNFCDGLRKACHKAYCKKIFGVTVCEPVTYGLCTQVAETYCAAVKLVASSLYAKAQDLQTRYNKCIAENGGITPPVRCSNGKPEGAFWKERSPDSFCTTLTFVCSHGEIIKTGGFRSPRCIEP
jgi:hypothetical protein